MRDLKNFQDLQQSITSMGPSVAIFQFTFSPTAATVSSLVQVEMQRHQNPDLP